MFPPDDRWTRAAIAAGLVGIEVDGPRITGRLRGTELVMVPDERAPIAQVRASLDPGLDLGLSMAQRTLGAAGAIAIGDEDLDAEFDIEVDDAGRGARFFTPALRDALRLLHGSGQAFSMNDAGITLFLSPADLYEEEVVTRAFSSAAGIADHMIAARDALYEASELAPHASAWARLATTADLVLTRTPLALAGKLDGWPVRARAVRRRKSRYRIEIEVRFDEPLRLGLALRRARFVDWLRSDVEVGDADFDARVFLQAADSHASRLRVVLDRDTRRVLLDACERFTDVSMTDDGVVAAADAEDLEPAVVPATLVALRAACERVRRNARLGAGEGSPYR